jgi:hypothetical protein
MIVIRDLRAGDLDGTVTGAEEAVVTWRRVGDRFHLGDGLVWLAVLYARAGRRADARWAILQALELVREIDSPMGVVSVILGLAYVARWEERHEDAMRLVGAAESLRERVGGGAPSTSWRDSWGTRRPRPEPTSRRTPPSGPSRRVGP